jgi:crotonobetainyl-CoA:carnitine CoA-transferase CaiB-like acyl-CoA transferase
MAPGQFDEAPIGDLVAAPEAGAHTEEILMELGHEWEDITRLKDAGAII